MGRRKIKKYFKEKLKILNCRFLSLKCKIILFGKDAFYIRKALMTRNINFKGKGLELGPLAAPIMEKKDACVYYTDYTKTEDLKNKNKDNKYLDINKIVDLDFVWNPEKKLIDCVPSNLKFDYALASNVIEHVPNVIGWIKEIFAVLNDGGVLSLAIPDKRYNFDAYNPLTTCGDVIENWIRDERIPTPRQIYNCLSNAIVWLKFGKLVNTKIKLEKRERLYSDQSAFEFASNAYFNNRYIDVHCTTWTPESFRKIFEKLNGLNILKCEILDIIQNPLKFEFYVYLKKK